MLQRTQTLVKYLLNKFFKRCEKVSFFFIIAQNSINDSNRKIYNNYYLILIYI